jgi:hypothetical protein
MKSLDQKISNIRANPSGAKDFILADAKDADMAFGLASPGKDPVSGKTRSLADYRDQMREIVRQGLVDIMLMSASSSEVLTIRERLFDQSRVTPAVRANDTTDIHLLTGGTYAAEPSRPFRTATIEQIQSGKVNAEPHERRLGADLGLYSMTINNNIAFDYPTLAAYREFRIEAEQKGFRHFLEVFDPNACGHSCPSNIGRFLNDLIARTLAGVPTSGRPLFLKMPFHGRPAMEELVAYDPYLIPGILGGSAGTTYDAFRLLEEARESGARAALFGRKINTSEHQLTFVKYLRALADGQMKSADAVKAYHGELEKLKIKPTRALKEDLQSSATASAYSGSTAGAKPSSVAKPAPVAARSVIPAPAAPPLKPDGSPDFKKMSAAQKVAYSRARIAADLSRGDNGNSTGNSGKRRIS